MKYGRDRAWLEIDLNVVEHNYLNIKNFIGDKAQILPVIKANAYGLGAVGVGQLFQSLNCGLLAVATIEEAMELRSKGIVTDVLILGPINPEHTSLAADNKLQLTLVNLRQASLVSDAAVAAGKKVPAHIKVDSGLSRLGLVLKHHLPECLEEIEKITLLPGLDIMGIFTHTTNFAADDGIAKERAELEIFADLVTQLRKTLPYIKAHCLSSGTLLHFPEYIFDYVRIGALFYGMQPEYSAKFGVQQAVCLKAKIKQVKYLDPGCDVSYGPIYTVSRRTKIAIVPIGFADGLRRSLSNRGYMIVHGKKAGIIGKICCDYTILDVTDVPDVQEGDTVTIFGCDANEKQHIYDYAELYPGSISEVTASFTSRLPRFYTKNGIVVGQE